MARAQRTAQMNQFYGRFVERYLSDIDLDITHNIRPRYRGIAKVAADATGLGATKNNAMTLLTMTTSLPPCSKTSKYRNSLAYWRFTLLSHKAKIETLLQAVIQAAQRGVNCIILADAVGSSHFFRSRWIRTLRHAGVQVHTVVPVGILKTLFTRSDLRNHRKLLIIDKKIGYTGSYNLVDPQYFKQDSGVGEWVDVMMRCTGPMVLEMMAVFYADVAVENDDNLTGVQQYLSNYVEVIPALLPEKLQAGTIAAQVIPSAPNQGERVIYETIISAIYAATRQITITTPYFMYPMTPY